MAKEHENVITRFMGVEPIYINSALLSAQSRPRVYWTNINSHPSGLFGDLKCLIPQPKDKGVLLRDILENEVPEKYYLSDKMLSCFAEQTKNHTDKGNGFKFNPTTGDKKANCVTSRCYKMGVDDNYIVVSRGRDSAVLTPKRTEYGKQIRKDYEAGLIKEQRKNIQQLEPRLDGKTNCLTSVQKDNLVMQLSSFNQDKAISQENDKYLCLRANAGGVARGLGLFNPDGLKDFKIRRLTPTECKRLQTVPDWYDMSVVSDTQQYKMLGNGWTIEVIKYILNFAQ
jgi:site-specific DNA-cytosine methylase